MHAFTHSLAHRAPSATRPRMRWQPYNPLSSQTSSSSLSSQSPSSHSSTPSSSLSSPPSSTPNPNSKPVPHTQNPKETSSTRDSSKKQFAIGLVGQLIHPNFYLKKKQTYPPKPRRSSRQNPRRDLASSRHPSVIPPLPTHWRSRNWWFSRYQCNCQR
jgi:hypothetical protein